MALAYANLGRTLRWKGTYLGDPDKSAPIYDDAATACQQALALSNPNETSIILAKVCLVEIEVERYHLSITDQPATLKQQLNQLQMENVSSWSTTLFGLSEVLWGLLTCHSELCSESWLMGRDSEQSSE